MPLLQPNICPWITRLTQLMKKLYIHISYCDSSYPLDSDPIHDHSAQSVQGDCLNTEEQITKKRLYAPIQNTSINTDVH